MPKKRPRTPDFDVKVHLGRHFGVNGGGGRGKPGKQRQKSENSGLHSENSRKMG
jgi:hypothetical protein